MTPHDPGDGSRPKVPSGILGTLTLEQHADLADNDRIAKQWMDDLKSLYFWVPEGKYN